MARIVRTTRSPEKQARQAMRGSRRRGGVRAKPQTTGQRYRDRFKRVKKIRAAKNKRGTLIGGTRELIFMFVGLGLLLGFVGRVVGSAGMTTTAVIGGTAGAATTAGVSKYRQWRADRSPSVSKVKGRDQRKRYEARFTGRVDDNLRKQRAAQAANQPPPAPPKPTPPKGGPGKGTCQASCRRSKKPKKTCRCKAQPCFHGEEA